MLNIHKIEKCCEQCFQKRMHLVKYIYVCVCVCVSMYVRMLCMYVRMCMYECMCVCMFYVCIYICVCMYVCMYVCVYVCMYPRVELGPTFVKERRVVRSMKVEFATDALCTISDAQDDGFNPRRSNIILPTRFPVSGCSSKRCERS